MWFTVTPRAKTLTFKGKTNHLEPISFSTILALLVKYGKRTKVMGLRGLVSGQRNFLNSFSSALTKKHVNADQIKGQIYTLNQPKEKPALQFDFTLM